MADRVAVFIDGGYLDWVLRSCGVHGKLDYRAFVSALSGNKELLRAYYYHCLPWQSPTPTGDEAERFSRMQKFFDSLDRIPRFQVRKGRLAYRGQRSDGTSIFEQKQVDILLAVDVVRLCTKQQVSEIVLVTGDSDFLPAVSVAKDEGVLVRLVHGTGQNRPHNELWGAADERMPLTPEWFAGVVGPSLPPNP